MLYARRADYFDIELYFSWANDSLVRKNSFQSEPIPWRKHQEWFYDKLNNNNSYLYLIEDRGTPIGQVRFDVDGNEAWVAYTLDTQFRGMTLGRKLLQAAIKKFENECKTVKTLIAKVKDHNIPSIKIFMNLGFNIDEDNKENHVFFYSLHVNRASKND